MPKFLIGTSGWTYASWKGRFYPKDLPSRRYLAHYATEFSTTEVNYSFYHLPRPETYAKWAADVPDAFIFSVKASRFITHIKRLQAVEEAWATFVDNARKLEHHLGPILLQFPASLRCDERRLSSFLRQARLSGKDGPPLRLVFEFRHESWFKEPVYKLLRTHEAALCIADSPRYPRHNILTADFVYLRFHGPTRLFASNYPRRKLETEAKLIERYLRDGLDVYAYFNNDAMGHAVANARTLRRMVGPEEKIREE